MGKQKVGTMLKEMRERKGLTQVELANKAGIDQGYLAKLETGVKVNPSLAILQRIAKALRVPITELLS